MRPEPGSNTADAGGRRGRTQDGTGELDDLIQRIFTAGVLLGSALAGGMGTVTGVGEAIRRLDDAVRTIPAAGSGLPGTLLSVSSLPASSDDRAGSGPV